jgi:NADH:ubiquinone oxidoreductase subunit H
VTPDLENALYRTGALLTLVVVAFPIAAYLDRWASRPPGARVKIPLQPTLPFANALKMIAKRAALPGRADRLLTWLTPPLAIFTSALALGAIPWAPPLATPEGTIPVDLLAGKAPVALLLALWSLASVGIVATGYAGANALALLGGLRVFIVRGLAIATVAIAVLGVALIDGATSVDDLIRAQALTWGDYVPRLGMLQNPVGFVCAIWALAVASLRMERSRPDERADLIDPFAAESAGPLLFAQRLFETLELILTAAVIAACFLGGWSWLGDAAMEPTLPSVALGRAGIFGARWLVALLLLLAIRRALPRVRHDDAIRVLARLLPVAAAGTVGAILLGALVTG